MNKIQKVGIVIGTVTSMIAFAQENEDLEGIVVVGQAIKEKDKTFIQTGAVSTRDNIQSSTQSLDNIIRSVPGAFTQIDKSQGTISVNVRGTTGFGRVNTLIDGVPQTMYSSSTDDGGRGGSTSQFGSFVDPSFLTSVDIERGALTGKGGGNALMGSVNFKTIGVNDLVKDGHQIGAMTKMLFGTNAIGPEYMGAVSSKYNFDEQRWIGLLYGYSHRKISQDYKIGGGRKVTESSIDLESFEDDEREQTTTSPFNAEHVKQKPHSHLVKFEYGDKYNNIILSYRNYHNMLAGRKIDNNNYQLNYNFILPNSPLVNVNLLWGYNKGLQTYPKDRKINNRRLIKELDVISTSNVLDISNTLRYDFSGLGIESTLGINILKNKYYKSRHPSELNFHLDEGETTDDHEGIGITKTLETSTFQPDGNQKFTTFYLANSFNYNLFTLDLNANLVQYKYKGKRFRNVVDYIYELEDQANRLSAEQADNLMEKVINPLIDKYCIRDEDYRDGRDCDDASIMMFETGKRKKINYSAMLSANIHELFVPFISYSTSHRMPHTKEMFFSSVGDYGVNTQLNPEEAKTYQIGFSGFKENALTEGDILGFKTSMYKSFIKDYIFNVSRPGGAVRDYIFHRNKEDRIKIKGVEIELSYDLGWGYANLAFAHQKTNQPVSFSDANRSVTDESVGGVQGQGYGASRISVLPENYGSLDLGTRWLDRKLVIGSIAKYYGKSKRASSWDITRVTYPNSSYVKETLRNGESVPKQPMIFDFYMSYEPIKNLVIKGEIQNVFNKKYIDPLDSNNDSASQTFLNSEISDDQVTVLNNFARGRTAILSVNYKF